MDAHKCVRRSTQFEKMAGWSCKTLFVGRNLVQWPKGKRTCCCGEDLGHGQCKNTCPQNSATALEAQQVRILCSQLKLNKHTRVHCVCVDSAIAIGMSI